MPCGRSSDFFVTQRLCCFPFRRIHGVITACVHTWVIIASAGEVFRQSVDVAIELGRRLSVERVHRVGISGLCMTHSGLLWLRYCHTNNGAASLDKAGLHLASCSPHNAKGVHIPVRNRSVNDAVQQKQHALVLQVEFNLKSLTSTLPGNLGITSNFSSSLIARSLLLARRLCATHNSPNAILLDCRDVSLFGENIQHHFSSGTDTKSCSSASLSFWLLRVSP
jgi:hypothetical protein